ncbi:MAG: hypothetical protein AAGF12_12675 [Myxococcota bacterium]
MARALLLVLAVGCSGESTPVTEVRATEPEPSVESFAAEEESIYDPLGDLRESTESVVGLVLPRGLEPEEGVDRERRHVYFSQVPVGTLQRYFERRLITGNVQESGHRITFRNAVPREARGAVVRIDLTLRPSSRGGTRVDIQEAPAPAAAAEQISAREIRERQLEAASMWD